jgi:DNA modification methylase
MEANIFPEDLIGIIINFTTQEGDWVLDRFDGRGTSGMVSEYRHRRFRGIDLYAENISHPFENIRSVKLGKITLNLSSDKA